MSQTIQPPIAAKIPHSTTIHGRTLVDNYAWLRGKEKPEVIEYLNQENAYTESVMSTTKAVQEKLYAELRSRIQETDETYPDQMGEYFYYSRTEAGKQYSIYCRKHRALDAPEEIILDVNLLAEGHPFFTLGTLKISPDHTMLAYSFDLTGSEYFTIVVKDLASGALHPDALHDTDGSVVWLNDNATFLYVALDESFRCYKVFRHTLGSNQSDDLLLLHETDEAFAIAISKSKDDTTLLAHIGSSTTSECYYADANGSGDTLRLFARRIHEIDYSLDVANGNFYIHTNNNAKNFKLLVAPLTDASPDKWHELIPHRPDTKLRSVEVFDHHLVALEMTGGMEQLRVQNLATDDVRYIPFTEVAYSLTQGRNFMPNAEQYRFNYSSPITPSTVMDYDFTTGEITKRKQVHVPGFTSDKYKVERVFARARDGAEIPLTIIMKQDTVLDGSHSLYLYGYGSYGMSMSDYFSASRFTLIDRGIIYAVAHVRGGGEMGEHWHDEGKMLKKKNTFTDFIDCAEYLVKNGYTSPKRIATEGRSAGGLLMGAITNMRPDLFKVVIAGVPFVDMMNTMLDATLPLTVGEYEEWGNPNEKRYFDYMLSYSPYDNVIPQDYPHILALAGLSDPRVSYWEPAKWVAKIRALRTDNHTILLKTQMESGHFGASGRFDYLKEIAFQQSFTLKMLEIE
ncbi:MAG: S9 family peptidase [Candidatus Kapaibacterium sp.]